VDSSTRKHTGFSTFSRDREYSKRLHHAGN
jgi:hypothetical protein